MCAFIPGQQGGACTQHSNLGRGSGWLTFYLGTGRLGSLAESLLKTVEGEGEGKEMRSTGGQGRGVLHEKGNFTIEIGNLIYTLFSIVEE